MSATGDVADRSSAESGATLIEALAVVTFSTIVSLVAFPRMEPGFLTLARRQILTAVGERLREARAAALGRDGTVVFAAASDGRSYGTSVGPASPTPSGIGVFVDGRARIAFYGDGSSSGGVVRVRTGQRTLAVRVAPSGGAVATDWP